MQILKEQGTFKILANTPHMETLIERCARVSYKSEDKIEEGSAEKLIRKLIKLGHHSVLEHASITVLFENHSRGFTHELVRHRLCAFTQESTRYVDQSNYEFVIPFDMDPKEEYGIDSVLVDTADIFDIVEHMKSIYTSLLNAGWQKQDARQFLPIGITSDIVVTANVREWRHIFKMRCASSAHWEIRRTMRNLLEEFKHCWPILFEDLD
jgi:thymidylate synthase (FAD)